MGGAFSRKKHREEEFICEQIPKCDATVTAAEPEKLDTDDDRINGKKVDCLHTHDMVTGAYIDLKIWQNFVPPPRP
ncbi:hypothetical protein Q1695_002450 [Nippostrongylus brasiliensis]|nr:hypothetical protein Q1695_002450 [Nippostrongylus brasiliensis]